MKYVKPSIRLSEAQAAQMLAESLNVISDKTIDGSQALTNENTDWDIWSSEE